METIDFNTVIAENISVVEGLLSPYKIIRNVTATDEVLDNCTSEGIYKLSQPSSGSYGPNDHGFLMVCRITDRLFIQCMYSIRSAIYIRYFAASTMTWSDWNEIKGEQG